MHWPTKLGLTAATAALAITALGTPITATGPADVAIVQGIPGKTVDICLGSRELKSSFKYGRWFATRLPDDTYNLRVRSAAPGKCTGQLILQRSLVVVAGADLTLVVTAQSPMRLLVFDNTGLGALVPGVVGSFLALRHAADLGPVTFKWGQLEPVSDPIWVKGDQVTGGEGGHVPVGVVVTRPDSARPIASTVTEFGGIVDVTRIEWIFVGTKPRNARLVTITRIVEE